MYVLNVVDGCIPSDMATGTTDEIEEERRLLYVAMTRAKDAPAPASCRSASTCTQQAGGGDRHVYAPRTRFIPDALLDALRRRRPFAAPASAQGTPVEGAQPQVIDLGARIRSRWA